MDNNLKKMLMDVISREGGYVNHPNDKGGPTNMGITQKTLSIYFGRPATIEEVKTLSIEQAMEIYERNYFFNPRINTLPEEIQPIVLDCAVLYGTKRAIIFLQNIVNEAGFGPVGVDGVLGPQTRGQVEKAFSAMGDFFINAIVEERINFCNKIVAGNPSQSVFLKGWIRRAEEFRKKID